MSYRYWIKFFASGLTPVLTLFAITMIASGIAGEGVFGCDDAKQYGADGSSKVISGFSVAPRVDANFREPNCARPESKEYADLCQQRRTADSAAEASCYSGWQTGIALCGLVGLGITVLYASRTVGQMARDAEVSIRRESAILHPTGVRADWGYPDHLAVNLKNYGRSVAVLIDASVTTKVGADVVLLPDPNYATEISKAGDIVDEREDVTVLDIIDMPGLRHVFDGSERAVVWGYIRYRDIFGRTRRRGFGFRSEFVLTVDAEDGSEGDPELVWSEAGGDAYNYDREET